MIVKLTFWKFHRSWAIFGTFQFVVFVIQTSSTCRNVNIAVWTPCALDIIPCIHTYNTSTSIRKKEVVFVSRQTNKWSQSIKEKHCTCSLCFMVALTCTCMLALHPFPYEEKRSHALACHRGFEKQGLQSATLNHAKWPLLLKCQRWMFQISFPKGEKLHALLILLPWQLFTSPLFFLSSLLPSWFLSRVSPYPG